MNAVKSTLHLLFLIFITSQTNAQNSNSIIDVPGDIAFVAYHDNIDGFSFVFLDECPNNTQIIFTDKEWNGSVFESGEGSVVWTNNTGNTILKGVVVDIQSANSNPNSSSGTAVETSGSGFTTGTANDQIYAVIGSIVSEIPVPTAFLAFIGGLDGSVPATLTNTGLTNGSTACVIEDFEGYYNGSTICNGTPIQCATMINTSSNWFIGGFTFPNNSPSAFTGSALPVELINFEGRVISDGVLLDWQTASEVNNKHFTLERSADGDTFFEITKVAGQGNSTLFNNYSFIDRLATQGINYYNLSQTDFNGKHQFLKTIAIDFGQTNNEWLTIPNPFNQQLKISFNSRPVKNAQINIYDVNGRLKYSQRLKEDEFEMTINSNNWSTGIYSIQIISSQKVSTTQVMKVDN
ncbi:MAG: T9SS type A sorting domain-containing protein [Saprospiraceae bacterium]